MKAARNMNFTAKRRTRTRSLLPGVDTFTKGNYQYPISQVTAGAVREQRVPAASGKLINGRGA